MKYLLLATITYLLLIITLTIISNIPSWLAQMEKNVTSELINSVACEMHYRSMGNGLEFVNTCG